MVVYIEREREEGVQQGSTEREIVRQTNRWYIRQTVGLRVRQMGLDGLKKNGVRRHEK